MEMTIIVFRPLENFYDYVILNLYYDDLLHHYDIHDHHYEHHNHHEHHEHHYNGQQHGVYGDKWPGHRPDLRLPLHLQRGDLQQLRRLDIRRTASRDHLVLHQGTPGLQQGQMLIGRDRNAPVTLTLSY